MHLFHLLRKILHIKPKSEWIYGMCEHREARKHRKTGNIQFVLWKAGEKGHKEDLWHDFGNGWEDYFVEND